MTRTTQTTTRAIAAGALELGTLGQGTRNPGGTERESTRPRRSSAAAVPASVPVPVPATVLDLLARSDAELLAAQLASDPGERLVHAHLAALRAGAALLEVTGRPRRRPVPRTVWDMVSAVAPDLAAWTSFFAAGASLRSAVEAGRADAVDEARAGRTVAAAEDFQDAVRDQLERLTGAVQGGLALSASGLRAS